MTNRDKKINEATVSSSSGKYSNVPLVPGERLFNKQQMQPFHIPTSKYDSAELAYDSYDGKMSTPKKDIQKKEKMARKVSKYIRNHPIQSDDDGNVLTGPLTVKEGWVEITQNTDVDLLTEDLAVWFDLNKSGLRVFGAILGTMQNGSIGKDIVYIDHSSQSTKEFGISKATFYRGIEELLEKKFIARHKSLGLYFINPAIFFNGNRARFIKEYSIKSRASKVIKHLP